MTTQRKCRRHRAANCYSCSRSYGSPSSSSDMSSIWFALNTYGSIGDEIYSPSTSGGDIISPSDSSSSSDFGGGDFSSSYDSGSSSDFGGGGDF